MKDIDRLLAGFYSQLNLLVRDVKWWNHAPVLDCGVLRKDKKRFRSEIDTYLSEINCFIEDLKESGVEISAFDYDQVLVRQSSTYAFDTHVKVIKHQQMDVLFINDFTFSTMGKIVKVNVDKPVGQPIKLKLLWIGENQEKHTIHVVINSTHSLNNDLIVKCNVDCEDETLRNGIVPLMYSI